MSSSPYASLPAVHILQRHPAVQAAAGSHTNTQIVAAVRAVLQEARDAIRASGKAQPPRFEVDTLAEQVKERLGRSPGPVFRSVINGSGILFNPEAGTPPVSEASRTAMIQAAMPGMADGTDSVERRICALTRAEDALVVSSAPAAFYLTMKALSEDRDIIVARSQLGMREDGFRPLQVMQEIGACVVEVGATNKAHRADYEKALGPQTGVLAVIRPTTYALRGFTQEVPVRTLSEIGHTAGVPVVYDAGCTTLRSVKSDLWQPPVSVASALGDGASAVIARSDGLMGGPGCGLIIGSGETVARIRRHPLAPVLEAGVVVRAGLHARSAELEETENDLENHPAAWMLTAAPETVLHRAEQVCRLLTDAGAVDIIPHTSFLTPSRLPAESLPGYAIAIRSSSDTAAVTAQWRSSSPALLSSTDGERMLIDMRGVADDQLETVAQIIQNTIQEFGL